MRHRGLIACAVVALVYVVLSVLTTIAFDLGSMSRGLLEHDRAALWRLRPGFSGPPSGPPGLVDRGSSLVPVRIDERGFRRIANDGGAEGGRKTVLTIGDSFTFGWDVADDETYPAQLQALLDSRAPGRFAVINGGMPGCTSFQAKQLLRRWVPDLMPAVLVTLLGRNDGRRASLSDAEVHAFLRWKPDLLNYVFPFMFVHFRSMQSFAQARGRGPVPRVSNDDFTSNMEAIVEIARATDVRLIVMEHWKTNPAFRLASFARARGLAYIDTPQRLAEAASGGRELFIRSHYHPNRDGYAVIAAALADQILAGD